MANGLNKNTKYTHLIERCNVAMRALAKWRCREVCGYTLSEAYWRIRDNKGLMNTFDRETLELWSKVITKFRRHSGCPVTLDDGDYNALKASRERILKEMERYRDMLVYKAEKEPERLCGDYDFLADAAILEQFNLNNLDWKLLDEDSLDGFIKSIDYDAINQRVNDLIPRYRAFIKDQNEKIAELRKQEEAIGEAYSNRVEAAIKAGLDDTSINAIRKEGQKKGEEIHNKISVQISRDFYMELPGKLRGKLQRVEDDVIYIEVKDKNDERKDKVKAKYKVWQIRTDMAHRSSKGADISDTLYNFWDVKQYTDDDTRQIIIDDLKCIDDYLQWKIDWKEADEANYFETKKHLKYDSHKMAVKINTFYSSLQVPRHPLDHGGEDIEEVKLRDKYAAFHKSHPDVSFRDYEKMLYDLQSRMLELGV